MELVFWSISSESILIILLVRYQNEAGSVTSGPLFHLKSLIHSAGFRMYSTKIIRNEPTKLSLSILFHILLSHKHQNSFIY